MNQPKAGKKVLDNELRVFADSDVSQRKEDEQLERILYKLLKLTTLWFQNLMELENRVGVNT
ncbi:hypothetical protein M8C21_014622, partial [Ambrosia artemisiifolia]